MPSLWIALRPTVPEAERLARYGALNQPALQGVPLFALQAVSTPAEQLHLTLTFHGRMADLPPSADRRARRAVQSVAARWPAVWGTATARKVWSTPAGVTVYAAVRSPSVRLLRTNLVAALRKEGLPPSGEHRFVPHVTLAQAPAGSVPPLVSVALPELPLTFAAIYLHAGERVECHYLDAR